MRPATLCVLSVAVFPGDDTLHRDSFWCSSMSWKAEGWEMHNSSELILITSSECAQIKVGVSAVTLKRGF